ncbi:ATP-binding protein [Timonella sp. A28]|uniref:ATP-binding protein n=1 Tax=Timonella sp. A28 TaxID=3442640 RepID=UPI003EBDB362
MTFVDTLFGLIPQASTGQQWVARSMQLVNWGGYNGYHQVPFHPDGTLISGGSGTGKSTLLDAYIALMMPHTTPFNGASNGATTGRARSKDQRNIISYVRGKVDDQRDSATDTLKDSVLRGDKGDTWSAIAMTWMDQSKQLFTAVRIFYVPKGATKNEDCTFRRVVIHNACDIRVLEQYAAGKFAPSILTGTLGLTLLDTDLAFMTKIQSVLGIGAHGEGDKALQLLARIQAGQQISTVDALYKQMVLEEPETFRIADDAIAHFDELSAVRQEMMRAEGQVELLTPIPRLRGERDEALERASLISELGTLHSAGSSEVTDSSIFGLWRDRNALDLITREVTANRTAHAAAKAAKVSATAGIAHDEAQLEVVRDNQRKSGGDQVESLNREIAAAENTVHETQVQYTRFERVLAVTGLNVAKKSEFDALTRTAQQEIKDSEGAAQRRREAEYEAMNVRHKVQEDIDKTKHELSLLRATKGNIPFELLEARLAFAQEMGERPEDLPFVGELIEIRPEYENWREALGLALGGFATTILVDAAKLAHFRTAINAVKTSRRIQFEGVDVGLRIDEPRDRSVLPGRLDYKHTHFTGWLIERLEKQFNFVCVNTPTELKEYAKALTSTGQMSHGSRGAHGGQGQRSVIGFSNDVRIRECVAALEELQRKLTEADVMVDSVTAAAEHQQKKVDAFARLLEFDWQRIDVAGAQRAVESKNAQLEQLIAGNDVLTALQHEERDILKRLETQRRSQARAEASLEALNAELERLVEKEDAAKDAIEAAEEHTIDVTPEQNQYLTELVENVDEAQWKASLSEFEKAVSLMRAHIKHEHDTVATVAAHAGSNLTRIFDRFKESWPNPNLGSDPDSSYDDYARILNDLEREKLYAIKEQWNRNVARLSGQEFTRLNAHMTQALDHIRTRMAPVNDILWNLPFQDDNHRLRISAKSTESPDIKSFRRQLRELAADTSGEHSLKQRETRYKKIADLLARIRPESAERRRLIDVREHVRIEALKVDIDGNEVSVFDHIAGKSGGESQELVAFIVGSALRYQLGDSDAVRPRYAPVFLDEAFIKADSRFAGRAVTAWQGLGFQLIIGAPLDKVSALEPHMSLLIQTVKNTQGCTHLTWSIPTEATVESA